MGTSHFSGLNIKVSAIAEGAAGAHTVTGITTDDVILAVVGHKITLSEGSPNTIAVSALNLTSEFTITATNTIDNTGGSSLADSLVLVIWLDKDAS